MKAIAVRWTPKVNQLQIQCDHCGHVWWHRIDRWKVFCPCCRAVGSTETLRNEFAQKKQETTCRTIS